MILQKKTITNFQNTIYEYYKIFKRPFVWRETTDPYKIFVSEVMLQQTQTKRVIPKYKAFIKKFPTFEMLANASLHDVLLAWQGLGYNRRGQNLQKSAQIIVKEYGGILSDDPEKLIKLPGIGKATAASIPAFAFNKPTVFVETNIRVVLFHFFFQDQETICDKKLLELVAQTLDKKNPRDWYYALMDYGVMLKSLGINPLQKSKHYTKQSKFQGSDRQIRGAIIRELLKQEQTESELIKLLEKSYQAKPDRIKKIVAQLCAEQLLCKTKDLLKIKT